MATPLGKYGAIMNPQFWKNKRIFLTGHTGFKGSWLAFWLHKMGAEVTGYAFAPATTPNMFSILQLNECIKSHFGDVRDLEKLKHIMEVSRPEIVFHLAAQPLVLESYKSPLETYATNVMGTANLLECCRGRPFL